MREAGISYGITKDDPPSPPRPATRHKPITVVKANFDSKCPDCGEWVFAGKLIVAVDDGYGGVAWVCESCGEDA